MAASPNSLQGVGKEEMTHVGQVHKVRVGSSNHILNSMGRGGSRGGGGGGWCHASQVSAPFGDIGLSGGGGGQVRFLGGPSDASLEAFVSPTGARYAISQGSLTSKI